ncbi:hypothetical protein EGW08_021106, partial [Elysia chlorotica]
IFTFSHQNTECRTYDLRTFNYTQVLGNIPSSPIVSPENGNTSVEDDVSDVEHTINARKHDTPKGHQKSVTKQNNQSLITTRTNISRFASLECNTSEPFTSVFSMKTLGNANFLKKSISTENKTAHDPSILLPPIRSLMKASLKFSNRSGSPEETVGPSATLSCRGRCGDRGNFPCSCTDICIVQGNCCYDMTIECPQMLLPAKLRFMHLRWVEVECSSLTYTFMIMSCPGHSGANGENISEAPTTLSRHEKNGGDKFGNASSDSGKTTEPSTFIGGNAEPFDQALRDTTESTPQVDDKTPSFVSTITALMLNTPVTDVSTGLVYRNRSVAQCNGVPDLYIMRWQVQAPVIATDLKAQNVEVLDQILTTKIVVYMMPNLPANVSTVSQCIPNSIRHYREEWITDQPQLETLCHSRGFTYHQVRVPSKMFFDNMYCLICYLGSADNSSLVSDYEPSQRTFKLSVVLSLSNDGTLSLLTKDYSTPPKLYWDALTCSINSSTSGDGQCSTSKCAPGYEKRPDGSCRIFRSTKFYFGRDNCMFTRSKELERRLLSLIQCYLETARNAELLAESARFDLVYDTRLEIPLLQLEVDVYYLYLQSYNDQFNNRRELSLLAYAANFC